MASLGGRESSLPHSKYEVDVDHVSVPILHIFMTIARTQIEILHVTCDVEQMISPQ